ncbi:putative GATA type zinc finger transcription factor family protein [Tripterygium wilfordii]|uniref:Putative GATA type zinc finger transcription factor family protein n=1 Tax=Tripterygium wilfordii TaxID=458696 RepID=A0A7J7DAV0_TRIWF|nr:putative GATA transcription factor 22 [Tripterygium wilfordii]KAF5743196.1 putative GATA type zinc finger transcription factor family protein [Tripterygium wilfordii]
MTSSPVYPSSPFPLEKLKEEIKPQLQQLLLSPHHDHQASASTSSLSNAPTCFNMIHSHQHDHKMENCDGSKWIMSSKMRLMQQKMIMSSDCTTTDEAKPVKFTQAPPRDHHNNNTSYSSSSNVRVCADCNTTTTPLWRTGPQGPKSLCNACGIRQRKARRAAAAETNSPSAKAKTSKHKKSSKTHVSLQCKKQNRPPDHHQSQNKNLWLSLSRNSTFQTVLPQDVEEAAILLMELSCGT